MQNSAPREASPSPSFRERQRAIKAHSMPVVPTVSQVLSNTSQPTHQQPSPTSSNSSHQSRRTPPPTSRISPTAPKQLINTSNPNSGQRELSPERIGSPHPPLTHSLSQPLIPHLVNMSTQSPPNVHAHQPRPMWTSSPQFLQQFQTQDEKWAVTEQLMADFQRADQEQGSLQGTSGVAYAGGAASNSIHIPYATARDPVVDRVRGSELSNASKDSDGGSKRMVSREMDREAQIPRESPRTRERGQTITSIADSQNRTQDRTPEFHGSPQYQSQTTPSERTPVYTQYIHDATTQLSSPSTTRKPIVPSAPTPPIPAKQPTQSSPIPTMNVRPPDRSLPVQEEAEEDVTHDTPLQHHSPPAVYQDSSSRYDDRRRSAESTGSHHKEDDDDEQTLNEEADEQQHQQNKSGDDDDSGYTPRSPSTSLPERPRDATGFLNTPNQYSQYSQNAFDGQKTIRATRHRNGVTDQLGMRNFDAAIFEQNVSHNRSTSEDTGRGQQRAQTLPQPHTNSPLKSMSNYTGSFHPEDLQNLNFLDDPSSSYLQSFLRSPSSRPNAPIPPTPQSHTAAPSPSPAISAAPSEIEARQVGSPYPYPFTHIRRTALSAAQMAPSSSYDPNQLAAVREQFAQQMQIYAINNGFAPPSESTFSPSSTPFPGPGYNPWAFVHQASREGDSNMSLRSSPSHEPIPMPIPPTSRGRGLRHKNPSINLRSGANGRRRVKPPPRVESTQPRDTSPEPSSGEETAGEDMFSEHLVPDEQQQYVYDGPLEDDGEWVDENDEAEEDLLQLEYHPSYISRTEKRKKRWQKRWDALVQALQALDRETDTTLVLLAAPPDSTKLHAVTSRSIRRDPTLAGSRALANIRSSFNALATQRRASRTPSYSLADHITSALSATSSESTQLGDSREEELSRALQAAMGSFGALRKVFDQREARWMAERGRMSEEREYVEQLMQHMFGPGIPNGHRTESLI
ncbi:hypothetical protein C8Q75DRAFT_772157 [Abortiporus biennis]|nr:hypothetical protein C8Q75DRAFT_772157 [Abortiporus biennis]